MSNVHFIQSNQRLWILWCTCLVALLYSGNGVASVVQHCQRTPDYIGEVCINRIQGSVSKDVIYFFHGIGMRTSDWPYDSSVRRLSTGWEQLGSQAPTVISISYGRFWLAAPRNSAPSSGLLERLAEWEIPRIESTLPFRPRKRFVIGASMGGMNSLVVTMAYPHLFDRAILVCPAVIDLSPFANFRTTARFMREHRRISNGVRLPYVLAYQILGQTVLGGEEDWRHINPFVVLQDPAVRLPPIFLSTGSGDQFGFFKGSVDFAELLRNRGDEFVWRPVQGRHCNFDSAEAWNFLKIGLE